MDFTEQITKAVLESAQEAFKGQLAVEAKEAAQLLDLSSAIGATGSVNFSGAIEGNIVITLSVEGACKIASKLLNADTKEITQPALDQLNKFIAMIFTGIQTRINAGKNDVQFGALAVVKGQGPLAAPPLDATLITKNFSSDISALKIEVIWQEKQAKELSVKSEETAAAAPPSPAPEKGQAPPPKLAEETASPELVVSLGDLLKDEEAKKKEALAQGSPATSGTSHAILNQLDKQDAASEDKDKPKSDSLVPGEPVPAAEDKDFMTDAMRKLEEVLKKYQQVQ